MEKTQLFFSIRQQSMVDSTSLAAECMQCHVPWQWILESLSIFKLLIMKEQEKKASSKKLQWTMLNSMVKSRAELSDHSLRWYNSPEARENRTVKCCCLRPSSHFSDRHIVSCTSKAQKWRRFLGKAQRTLIWAWEERDSTDWELRAAFKIIT